MKTVFCSKNDKLFKRVGKCDNNFKTNKKEYGGIKTQIPNDRRKLPRKTKEPMVRQMKGKSKEAEPNKLLHKMDTKDHRTNKENLGIQDSLPLEVDSMKEAYDKSNWKEKEESAKIRNEAGNRKELGQIQDTISKADGMWNSDQNRKHGSIM